MATTSPAAPPKAAPLPDIQSAPPLVGFNLKDLPPAQPLYLQPNDFIGFFFITNLANQQVKCNYRYLTTDGFIKEGSFTTKLFNSTLFQQITLGEGWLISFALEQVSGAIGQWCFCQVGLQRQAGLLNPFLTTYAAIWQGYVPAGAPEGWPGTASKYIGEGPGYLHHIIGTTPGAGAEINETPNINGRSLLLTFTAALTTSATVANRFPGFKLQFLGLTLMFIAHSSVAQVASTTVRYSLVPNQPFYNDTNGFQILPAPPNVLLDSSYTIQSDTIGLQAGDQWSQPLYLWQEWGTWDQ